MKLSSYSQGKIWCVFLYKSGWFVRNGCIKYMPNTESETEEIAGLQTVIFRPHCHYVTRLISSTHCFSGGQEV